MFINILKSTFLLLLIVAPSILFSQVNLPQTRYGLGKLSERTFAINSAMGGLSSAYSSYENINFVNPASYAAFYQPVYSTLYTINKRDTIVTDPTTGEGQTIVLIDSIPRDTIIGVIKSTTFESGVSGAIYNIFDQTGNIQTGNATLGYLAFGFPIPKFGGISFGLMPYSNVDYNLIKRSNVLLADTLQEQVQRSVGSGGIFQAYFGGAYRYKNFSFGANIMYLFGTIDIDNLVYIPAEPNFFGTRASVVRHVRGFSWNVGAQYNFDLGDDLKLRVGVHGKPGTQISMRTDSAVDRVSVLSDEVFNHLDTISRAQANGKLGLPVEIGAGVMLEKEGTWMLGADYKMYQWSDVSGISSNTVLNNNWSLSIGGQVIPDREGSFLQRTKYRFGGYYGTEYFLLNNNELNNYGITFGLGIPVKRDRKNIASSIDLAFQFGKSGSIADNLISENFFKFTLGFNLNDNSWIFQTKYY